MYTVRHIVRHVMDDSFSQPYCKYFSHPKTPFSGLANSLKQQIAKGPAREHVFDMQINQSSALRPLAGPYNPGSNSPLSSSCQVQVPRN